MLTAISISHKCQTPEPFTKNSFALYLNDSYKYNIFGKFWDHRELEPKRYEETTT